MALVSRGALKPRYEGQFDSEGRIMRFKSRGTESQILGLSESGSPGRGKEEVCKDLGCNECELR